MSDDVAVMPGFFAHKGLVFTLRNSLTGEEYHESCPLGMHREGDVCVYDDETPPEEGWVEADNGWGGEEEPPLNEFAFYPPRYI